MNKNFIYFIIFLIHILLSCSKNKTNSFEGIVFTDENGSTMGSTDNGEDWKFDAQLSSKENLLFPTKYESGLKSDSLLIFVYPNPNNGHLIINLKLNSNCKMNLVLVDNNYNIHFKGLNYNLQSGNNSIMITYKVPSNKPVLRLYYQIIQNNKETKGYGDIQSA